MITVHEYLTLVAKEAFDKYGDDFYEALNAAECIVKDCKEENISRYAQEVHAAVEGEL